MVAHLHGEKVEARIDTGSRVVTRQDLDDPAVKEIVRPDLAEVARGVSGPCGGERAPLLEVTGLAKAFGETRCCATSRCG